MSSLSVHYRKFYFEKCPTILENSSTEKVICRSLRKVMISEVETECVKNIKKQRNTTKHNNNKTQHNVQPDYHI